MSPARFAAMAAFALLAACNPATDKAAGPAEPESRTLAQIITAESEFGRLESIVENAQLQAVLEGVGPYTVFAPSDAALGAFDALDDEAGAAPAAQLLRAHIAPGVLTRADITRALDQADGQVQVRTMADQVLTFSRDGETLIVTTPDGAQARLSGEERLAENGALQPLDAALVPAPEG